MVFDRDSGKIRVGEKLNVKYILYIANVTFYILLLCGL